MSDSISRHAALVKCYELQEARRHWDTEIGRAEIRGIDAAMCALISLPSEHPERIRAMWEKQVLGWKCSNCTACTNDFGAREFNFCPSCGAYMEVSK